MDAPLRWCRAAFFLVSFPIVGFQVRRPTQRSDTRVESYADFCEYLEHAAPGIETAFLPLEGRNKVIFRRAVAAPQPQRALTIPAQEYMPQSATRQQTLAEN
eukprot:4980877-Pyramimonas_sp.AAC.2